MFISAGVALAHSLVGNTGGVSGVSDASAGTAGGSMLLPPPPHAASNKSPISIRVGIHRGRFIGGAAADMHQMEKTKTRRSVGGSWPPQTHRLPSVDCARFVSRS